MFLQPVEKSFYKPEPVTQFSQLTQPSVLFQQEFRHIVFVCRAERMAAEVREFSEFQQKMNDTEKATLRLEVEKLRALMPFLDEMIQQGLTRTRNNKSRLARELGISRSNLILKIAKYGLGKGDDDDLDAAEALT